MIYAQLHAGLKISASPDRRSSDFMLLAIVIWVYSRKFGANITSSLDFGVTLGVISRLTAGNYVVKLSLNLGVAIGARAGERSYP